MNFKKMVCLLAAVIMIAGIFAGCGKAAGPTEKTAAIVASTQADTKPADTKPVDTKPVLDKNYSVKYAVPASSAEGDSVKKLITIANNAGLKIELIPIPGTGQDFFNKLNVSLMSGDEIDLFDSNPLFTYNFSKAKLLTELDDIAVKNGVDLNKTFGINLVKQDGKVLGIPTGKDQWITLFNKKIFDDAKVPYPTADGWTWSKYIETAKKITNTAKGIYGSYMLDYDSFNYMIAAQKKIPAYKADGTSNFDDPEYKYALKFFYDLGNVEKIQPDFLTFKSKKLQWDDFARGKYGMFVCGSWSMGLMSDTKSWPRDWKFGVLPMPSLDNGSRTALSIIGQIVVPSTTKHPNEAFMAAYAMASNYHKLYNGQITNVTLSQEDKDDWYKNVLVKFNNEITSDEYNAAFKDIEPVSEKIIGKGANGIAQAFLSEGEAYGVGQKSLDDAVKAIKEKADAAIAADK